MRTTVLSLLLCGALVSVAPAQTPQEDVRAAIDRLFDGMRAGDSTMVRSVFHSNAVMARATDRGFSSNSPNGFVRAVGSSHDQVWDERIWDVEIRVDLRLAWAWMEFAFYLGDELHHCGVNSMQLYLADGSWKIAYLADTDRGLDCEVPTELQ